MKGIQRLAGVGLIGVVGLLLGGMQLVGGCTAEKVNPRLAATTAPTTRVFGKEAPDPLRFEKEIVKFEQADAANMPAKGAALFVGSSSIRGWKLGESFPEYVTINRGFGGSSASDVVHYVPRIVWPYKAGVVVFYAGENDISAGRSAEEVLGSVKEFVRLVREKQAGVKIVLVGIKPSPLRWDHRLEFRRANRLVEKWARGQRGLVFVDVEPAMLDEDGVVRGELFKSDRLHMNEKGYELWKGLLAQELSGAAKNR